MTGTKSHKTPQTGSYKPLSLEQQNAIDLLILGKPDREVAEAVGVTRETVWQWRSVNPVFVAEMNRRRKVLWGKAHERLRALVHKAVDVIAQAVERGDIKAAVEVLKIVKVHGGVLAPNGPEDPDLVLLHQAETWAQIEMQREGPSVDPLRMLLDENAGKQATLVQQRMAGLRQQWMITGDS